MRKITMIFALLAALMIALPVFATDDTDKASEDTTTETEVAGDATPPVSASPTEPDATEVESEK